MQSCLCRVLKISGGPGYEENLALIQTIFGENSRAISTLTRLLQTPYNSLHLRPSAHYTGPS